MGHTHTHTYTHTLECYSAFKKKEILPFSWLKWNRGHYAKWNKPERQIWHDLIYIWNLKYLKLSEAESGMVVTRGGENGEMARVSVMQEE